MRADWAALQSAVGYQFQDQELMCRALTHSSHAHEAAGSDSARRIDNEQLEFLGDAVLGFLISEALLSRFPDASEGRLSSLKAHLVSATHLFDIARRIDLGAYLNLGRGEEMSGGRAKRTLLVDSLEALIAAIYLDGGLDPVRRMVNRFVMGDGFTSERGLDQAFSPAHTDYKTALQELARTLRLPLPRYIVLKEHGPDHSKTFTVEVRVGAQWTAQASGFSKKSASQQAARELFDRMTAPTPTEPTFP